MPATWKQYTPYRALLALHEVSIQYADRVLASSACAALDKLLATEDLQGARTHATSQNFSPTANGAIQLVRRIGQDATRGWLSV